MTLAKSHMLIDGSHIFLQQSPAIGNPDAGGWPVWLGLLPVVVKVAPVLFVAFLAHRFWQRTETGWEVTPATAVGIPLATVSLELVLTISLLTQPGEHSFLVFYGGLAAVTGVGVVCGAAVKNRQLGVGIVAGIVGLAVFSRTLPLSPILMNSVLLGVSGLGSLSIGYVTAHPAESATNET